MKVISSLSSNVSLGKAPSNISFGMNPDTKAASQREGDDACLQFSMETDTKRVVIGKWYGD